MGKGNGAHSKKKKGPKNPRRTFPTPAEVEAFAHDCGLTKRDARMMAQACAEAYKSDFDDFRVGCALGNKNIVMSTGANVSKSDPAQREMNLKYRDFHTAVRYSCREHSIHAEIAALKGVAYPIAESADWKRIKAYVFRIAPGLPRGQGLAKPCEACTHMLKERGVRYVVYSTDDGFAIMDLLATSDEN